MKYATASLILTLAGFFGMLGWVADTCTGNSSDAAFVGLVVLPLNLIGIGLLAWRPTPTPLVLACLLPVPLALPYSVKTIQLAQAYFLKGQGVCDVVTAYGPWGPSGDDPFLLVLWFGTTAVFWLGLALAGWRAYRNVRKEAGVERSS